jgi:hypothetical protein
MTSIEEKPTMKLSIKYFNLNCDKPHVAIIVLNWNRSQDTIECLKSVEKIDYPNYEITVIDNGSTDGSPEIIKKMFPKINLIINKENLGYAEGNNIGIRYALNKKYPYIFVLNNDTVVAPDILNSFEEAASLYRDAGIFGAKIYYYSEPNKIWHAGGKWDDNKKTFDHIGYGALDEDNKFNNVKEIDYVTGSGIFFKREVFEKVGYYDTRFYLTHEEPDLCFRAKNMGFKCIFIPKAKIWHKVSVSFGGKGPLYAYFYTRNRLLWAQKNLPFIKKWFVYKTVIKELFPCVFNLNKYMLIKRLYWDIKGFKKPKSKAKLFGIKDFVFKRFGNCQQYIWHLNKDEKTAKILFVPNFRDNPYLNLLAKALGNTKFRVVFDQYQIGWPSLFRTARKHNDCNIIHIHWIHPYIDWLFWSRARFKKALKLVLYTIDILLIKVSGKKIIWTIHNKFMHESKDVSLEQKFRRILIRLSDEILVHSNYAIKELKNAYGLKSVKNFIVIPHGHYIDAYPNNINRNMARRKLNIEKTSKVFLYFGAIRSYKGVIRLIKEFRNNDNLKEAILLLVGKPFSEEIVKEIEYLVRDVKNIKPFLYFVPSEKIQLFMNAADIVVFPFGEILTSGSIILAMSFGKPVIAPRKGCLKDLLDEKGAIFFNEEPNAFGKALKKALSADFASMGECNRKTAMKYDWRKIGADLEVAYSKVLN